MGSQKIAIAIVNSSSFGISYPEHLRQLEAFADLVRVEIPKGAGASVFHEKLGNVAGIIASVTPTYTREVLLGLPKLQILARHGVGCDNVDLAACTELGIVVSRVGPEVERESVAQMALGLMNAAARQIVEGHSLVRAGEWSKRAQLPLGVDFNGATVGIVGIGAIGRTVSRILSLGYRAKVIAYDPYVSAKVIAANYATKVSFEELLERSAIVTLHCPLTHETSRMFCAKQLDAMNDRAILVNTCRGEIFNQADLINALNSGKLGGYATDVVEGEPIGAEHVLLATQNVIVTPHLGGYSVASLRGMGETMVNDMTRVFVENRFPAVIANPEIYLEKSRMTVFRKANKEQM
ncbi:NAD(P)-dependent oxidoreductase [Propionivibrio limicola]|uniref:NAD(P)-dependent oxidoreductase n=1 Tax=Propionivibrio limicola TaxID=167645 RepID=UPI0012928B87|nr:NAD(P)-dependent oxidoreductase [Propionivibrio limicola]